MLVFISYEKQCGLTINMVINKINKARTALIEEIEEVVITTLRKINNALIREGILVTHEMQIPLISLMDY